MFSNKPYFEINREERHFGFLFASALIHNQQFAKEVFTKFNEVADSNLSIDNYEIFLEVAALRDYWFDLGDPKKYIDETDQKRKLVLNLILRELEKELGKIDLESVYRTNSKKLMYPGDWKIVKLREASRRLFQLSYDPGKLEATKLNEEEILNKLISVKWAFNAKPDILIVSGDSAMFIEIKLESGVGNKGNYDQLTVQKEIAKWMKILVPAFRNTTFINSTLTLKQKPKGLMWKDIIEMLSRTSNDTPGSIYVEKCLRELSRYKDIVKNNANWQPLNS